MNLFEKVLLRKEKTFKPIWFMRQAGRYLPEFRKIRLKNKNFIELCLNSKLSSEITLQPLKRFKLDAAIIFSDILLIPFALGQKVEFIEKQGPQLSNFNLNKFLKSNRKYFLNSLDSVYQAINITRKELDQDKPLISFVGAPWTLIVYMLNLRKNKTELDELKLKEKEKEIKVIFNKIEQFLCAHIDSQVNAGANIVQIFDSWAGIIPEEKLKDYCYYPNKRIVQFCKKKKIPVICFPRGIKHNYLDFNNFVEPDGLNIDYEVDPNWAKKNLKDVCLQGGMNPKILLQPEKEIYNEAKKYMEIFKDVPYIFNLGHGLVPETKPESLEKLIKFVKNYT